MLLHILSAVRIKYLVMLVYAIQKNFVSRMHLPPFDWLDYLLDTKFIRVRPIEIFGTHYSIA